MTDASTSLLLEDVGKVFRARKTDSSRFFSKQTEVVALKNINLRIQRGEVTGIIGGNGSGKTTLLKIMSGALTPSTGKVLARHQPRLTSLSGLQLPSLSVLENTELLLRAHGRNSKQATQEAHQLIEWTELQEKTYLPYNTLSTGQRARLGFFLATIHQPELLLMDEVLSVSDERFAKQADQIVGQLIREAHAAVLVSHSVATIERLCRRTIWLSQGTIVADGPTQQILASYSPDPAAPASKQL